MIGLVDEWRLMKEKRAARASPAHSHSFLHQIKFSIWIWLEEIEWNGLARPPSFHLLHFISANTGRAAQGRSKLHFFSSPIRKNELKRNECFADGRLQRNQTVPFLQLLISLSFHYHSMKFHQLLKYFHCLIPLITVIIHFDSAN